MMMETFISLVFLILNRLRRFLDSIERAFCQDLGNTRGTRQRHNSSTRLTTRDKDELHKINKLHHSTFRRSTSYHGRRASGHVL